MPYRPRDIYRGHRKYRTPLIAAGCVLLTLLAAFVGLFFYLQRYLVYDKDGVSLVLPYMQDEQTGTDAAAGTAETDEPEATPIDVGQVEIVYENTDFSAVDLGGWDTLTAEQLCYIPYDTCCDIAALSAAVTGAQGGAYSGVVLSLKNGSGQLAWASTSETAAAYGTAGTVSLADTVTALHDAGMYVAAELCCCRDDLLAERDWTAALSDADGNTVTDEDGHACLDPYNRTLRTYLGELVCELADLGFDEVILSDMTVPVSDTTLTYPSEPEAGPDPTTAICQLGTQIVEALPEDSTAAVSVRLDAESLRSGTAAQTGQDITTFWHLFARLYCPTTVDEAPSDLEIAWASAAGGDSGIRFVPICTAAPAGFASYCIESE